VNDFKEHYVILTVIRHPSMQGHTELELERQINLTEHRAYQS